MLPVGASYCVVVWLHPHSTKQIEAYQAVGNALLLLVGDYAPFKLITRFFESIIMFCLVVHFVVLNKLSHG